MLDGFRKCSTNQTATQLSWQEGGFVQKHLLALLASEAIIIQSNLRESNRIHRLRNTVTTHVRLFEFKKRFESGLRNGDRIDGVDWVTPGGTIRTRDPGPEQTRFEVLIFED